MRSLRILLACGLAIALPLGASAKDNDIERARKALETMKHVVKQIEAFSKETKDDAIRQTCIVNAHRDMVEIVASVEKTVAEAAGKGTGAEASALESVQTASATVDKLREEVYDCVGSDEAGGSGGTKRRSAYDPLEASNEAPAVGVPQLRAPAASPTK